MNYIHQTVNHSENFVDPTTGAHTLTIESLARIQDAKRRTHRYLVDIYLFEFIWEQRYRNADLSMQIIDDMSQFQPDQQKPTIKVSCPPFYLLFEWRGLTGKDPRK